MESKPSVESELLVVSLEQAVAAPLCSRKLADMGARVLKVEQPAGDFARGYDRAVKGQSSYFVWLNRGKESVSLDLRNANDVGLLESMANRADVFIQNIRPGTLPALGIDISRWRCANPRLVTCSTSGYGTSGPESRRKAYDLLVQAESGLASITGSPAEPSRVGISVIDIAAGVTAYEAILEALLRRTFTGLGDHIEVSLFDAIAEWMTVPLLHAAYAKPPRRLGLMHPSIAPYGAYACADGAQVLFSVQNQREWAAFCNRVVTSVNLRTDPRFHDNCARVENRQALDALIDEAIRAWSSREICRLLDDADIAYGLINELDDVLKHPRLRQCEVDTPAGPVLLPAPAARHARVTASIGPVPSLNQHGASIRSEFA